MLCVVPVLLFCIVLSELLEQPKQLKECSPETVLGIFSDQLPPANEVWGKVIFSEASVKNSVHRGVGGSLVRGVPASRGLSGSGGCLLRGGWVWSGGSGPGGVCLVPGGAGGDPRMATAAGGTHPTGMHSCSLVCSPDLPNV